MEPARNIYAALRSDWRVWAAFCAAFFRATGPLFRALLLACFDRAAVEAELCFSRFSAESTAEARLPEIRFLPELSPLRSSCVALFLVWAEAFPLAGGGSFTPALLALESPMAIACCGDLAPCFPSRT